MNDQEDWQCSTQGEAHTFSITNTQTQASRVDLMGECVCLSVCQQEKKKKRRTHTHTHTYRVMHLHPYTLTPSISPAPSPSVLPFQAQTRALINSHPRTRQCEEWVEASRRSRVRPASGIIREAEKSVRRRKKK